MKKEFEQIIDKMYSNYLENFITPETPIARDVQPGYYSPMDRDWFFKSILENNSRGKKFASQYGIVVDIRNLSLEERSVLSLKMGFEPIEYEILNNPISMFDTLNVPTKIITLTYNNEKIESYE